MKRSIVAEKKIPKDTIITGDMLELKRPATGLNPRFLEIIIGRKAKKDIYKDKLIELSDLF